MEQVLTGLISRQWPVYIDNILIFSVKTESVKARTMEVLAIWDFLKLSRPKMLGR
jgi:hypothetical protein